ncbi:tripartite tricarboxylate transporter TctB family protein [Aureimonas altamirensis]|uniref:tripartite tricarboxylate transporter TctB family protein n=1 Tax=Aureimonas altamirensis TaxID=370622 RepID=UPI00203765EA|nr:tripartite tricarboxylate transporter TctB family protein [Aureimonas altamirensis]MCM2502830.1 tripartite tricarboxylate transporter TctB family protein [Aureimonas altamirensis]
MRGGARQRGANAPDLLAGLLFIVLGAIGLLAGRDLEMGTLAAMGSGFLPNMISGFVVLVGLFVLALSVRGEPADIGTIALRPIVILLVAIGGYAIAAQYLGFVIGALWVVVIGSLADRSWRPLEMACLAIGLTIFTTVVFVFGLGVQMPLWPQ